MLNVRKLGKEVERVGYQFFACENCGNGFAVVLASNKNEFVTWTYNIENNSLFSGNYFSHFGNDIEKTFDEALKDYRKRIAKEKL